MSIYYYKLPIYFYLADTSDFPEYKAEELNPKATDTGELLLCRTSRASVWWVGGGRVWTLQFSSLIWRLPSPCALDNYHDSTLCIFPASRHLKNTTSSRFLQTFLPVSRSPKRALEDAMTSGPFFSSEAGIEFHDQLALVRFYFVL